MRLVDGAGGGGVTAAVVLFRSLNCSGDSGGGGDDWFGGWWLIRCGGDDQWLHVGLTSRGCYGVYVPRCFRLFRMNGGVLPRVMINGLLMERPPTFKK